MQKSHVIKRYKTLSNIGYHPIFALRNLIDKAGEQVRGLPSYTNCLPSATTFAHLLAENKRRSSTGQCLQL